MTVLIPAPLPFHQATAAPAMLRRPLWQQTIYSTVFQHTHCLAHVIQPKPDKPKSKKVAVFVGRMSAALSDMKMSEGAALFRPTTAQFLSRFDMI